MARAVALRVGLVAVLWLAIGATVVALAGRWEAGGTPIEHGDRRVLVFGIPHLGFADLSPRTTPTLWRLIHTRAAIAATSIRSHNGRPSTPEGYATLGAGARVAAPANAGLAVAADAPAGDSTAGDVLATRTGVQPDGAIVVPAGVPVLRAGIGGHQSSQAGALGQTLRRAGRTTAVVSNADVANPLTGRLQASRPAALALMDRSLAVNGGAVDRHLLTFGPYPSGARAKASAVIAATVRALRRADAVIVDPGDMDRADAFAGQALPSEAARARTTALRRTDALLGSLLRHVPASTLVLVVSVSPPPTANLTPTIALGPGIGRGLLSSPSSKRSGLIAITDLAPTILRALHGPVPGRMVGHRLVYTPGAPDLHRFAAMDAISASQTRLYGPAIIVDLVFQAVLFAAVLLALRAGRVLWRRPARLGALIVISFPLATYAVAAVPGLREAGATASGAGIAVIALALAGLFMLAGTRWRGQPFDALIWALAVTVAVPVVDVVAGGPLHQATLLGYSLPNGGRFYGWPNTTFALVGGAAPLLCALLVARFGRRPEVLAACFGLLALVAVADGSPSLGADVGGIVATVPIYTLFAWVLLGRRLTWRALVVAVLAGAAALGLAALIDVLGPLGSRTDLADFVLRIVRHGPGSAITEISRKASTNVTLVGHSIWTWTAVTMIAFAVGVLASPRRRAALLAAGSPLREGALAALALAILGFLVNDSGPLVIALALNALGPLLILGLVASGSAAPDAPAASADQHGRARLSPHGPDPRRRSYRRLMR